MLVNEGWFCYFHCGYFLTPPSLRDTSPIFCIAKHRGGGLMPFYHTIYQWDGSCSASSSAVLRSITRCGVVALAIYRRYHKVTEELRRYYIIFDWGVRGIKRTITNYRQSLKIYWLNIRFFLSRQTKKQIARKLQSALCGPTWAWTKDPLIMSQML